MSTPSRSASFVLALTLGLGALALPGTASAAPGGPGEPLANATTTAAVPTSSTTALSGLSVTDPTATDLLQVTLSTDLGSLTLPSTTGLTASYGDSFTTDPSISFTGTVTSVNNALAAARIVTGSTSGTAHVALKAMLTDAGTTYNPTTGHFYRLVTGNTTWTAAKAAAAQLSFHGLTGYLATPATSDTNTFLAGTYPTQRNLWIGGQATDATVLIGGLTLNRTWNWVTGPYSGTTFTTCVSLLGTCVHGADTGMYYSWALGQPDNAGIVVSEDYASTNYGTAGAWNDLNNDGGLLTMGGYLAEFGDAKTGTTAPTGLSTATANVVVANAPAAATGVTVASGDHSATVTFTAPTDPAGAPVTGYTVTATPSTGSPVVISCTASPCTVTGLTNGTSYAVTVQARNATGTGATTTAVDVTPAGVPGVPTNVSAAAGDGQVTVTYTAPSATNGAAITGYTVTATSGSTVRTTTCASASSCVLTGLTNGTGYTVTVHANNSAGSSADVSAGTVVPAGRPGGAPTGLSASAGDHSATLAFALVTSFPAVTGYTATVTPQGGAATTQPCATSGCTLAGLANGTSYSITVHATNSIGDGPESAAVTVTPAGRPGAPTGVTAEAGDQKVTVRYTAPSSTNGAPVSGYTVTATPTGGGAPVSGTCTGTSTSCVVAGLTNGTTYAVTVHATTTGGDSTEVSAGTVTPAGRPGAPTVVSTTPGDGQVTVTYTAPATTNGGAVTGYTVTATSSGTTRTSTCDAASTSCTVSGLTNGTGYTVTVHATTTGGDSDEVSAGTVTPATAPAAPTNVVAQRTDGGATITFTAPADPAGAAVTGYSVTTSPTPDQSSTTTCGAGSCTVSGLTPGTDYTFTVRATNRIGTSPASTPSNAVTAARAPAAPASVTADPKDGSAVLTITNGPANGAPVTGYTVTTSPAPSGGATTSCDTTNPCVVAGLADGTPYVFSVTAQNAVGTSPATTAGAVPQAKPAAPANLTASSSAPNTITVGFDTASATDPSAPTSYEYSLDNGLSWLPLSTSTSGSRTVGTIGTLANGTSYSVQVRGLSTYGTGTAATAPGNVTPVARPGTPAGPVTTQATDGGATVGFTAPASTTDAPVAGYVVTAYPAGGGSPTTTTCTTGPCSVSGLTVGTSYTFTVTATNASGSGSESVASAPLTIAARPGAPTGVSASPRDGKALVSFTAPASNGSPLTKYTVTAQPGGASTDCDAASTSCLVGGLVNGTGYTFTVTATNALGTSASSSASVAVTPRPVPVALAGVQATPGDGSVAVAFSTPTTGTAPTSYEYSFDGTTWSTATNVVDTAGTSTFTIGGLVDGTTYPHLYVRATSTYGSGPSSADLGPVTPATVPGAPGSPTATRLADGTVQLGFAAPSSDGGSPVLRYEYTTDGGTTWQLLPSTTTGSTVTGTVSGLTYGRAYGLAVRAVTAVGPSGSGPTVTIVPAAAPAAPTLVTVSPRDTSAVVSFGEPNGNGAQVTGYTVTATPIGGGSAVTRPCSGNPCTVLGLTNDTTYTVTVSASNAVGTSPASSASDPFTPRAAPGVVTGGQLTSDDGSVEVTFPTPTGPAAPTAYQYSLDEGVTWRTLTTSDLGGGTTGGTIADLTDGQPYHVLLRGTSSFGTGATTDLGYVTPAAAPATGVPGAPTAARQADGDVRLVFAVPTGLVPTGYQYTTDGGASWTDLVSTVSQGTVTATVTGLTLGRPYTIAVRALDGLVSAGPSAPVTVTPAALPGVPTGVTATAGDAVAGLAFTAPAANGDPITGYDVSTDGGTTWRPLTGIASVVPGQVTGVADGLTNGQAYAFSVRAVNALGASAGSTVSTAVTPRSAPAAPTGITVTPRPGSIVVALTPPVSSPTTSDPTGYEYSIDGGVTWHPLSTTAANGRLEGTISGLTNGTTYDVRVRGTSAFGNGTPAVAGSVTPVAAPGAPGIPSVVVDAMSATVSWTPGDTGGAGTVTYTVTSSPASRGCVTTATTCTVTGLTAGTTYVFTVTPSNAVGIGAAVASGQVPVAGTPSSPGSLSVAGGDRSLTVTFTPPSNPGGSPVTGYQVSIDGGLTWQWLQPSGSGVLTATIAPVLSGQTYPVVVRAVNGYGAGAATGVVLASSSSWYADPLSVRTRSKQVKVPRAPKHYHGKKRNTVATYRASGGQVVVPAGTPAGRQLQAGEGVQLTMRSLFKGNRSTKLTAKGRAQIAALATSLRYVHAVSCEGYTDYTLAHGKKVSSRRAAAVCRALVADGARVAASARGFGGKRPQVLAKRAGARRANNRIVVLVTGN